MRRFTHCTAGGRCAEHGTHRSGRFTRSTAPIVYATLIVVAAVVPVLFIEGLTGAFFKPLIAAYVLAIAASLVVAMTVTPALCLILLNTARPRGAIASGSLAAASYAPLMERATRTPRPAFITLGVVTLAGIGVWPLLGQSLLRRSRNATS